MIFAFSIMVISSIGILTPSRNIIELFLFVELISITSTYVFLAILIPSLFPIKTDPESIFIGGVGKPPYISADEIYSPQLPFFEGKIIEE